MNVLAPMIAQLLKLMLDKACTPECWKAAKICHGLWLLLCGNCHCPSVSLVIGSTWVGLVLLEI